MSPLDRDALRIRIRRAPRRHGRLSGLRTKWVAGLLTAGLMLTSGAGVVIACTSLGGGNDPHGGNNLGGNFRNTFRDTSFNHGRDASYCQYHGPVTKTFTFRTRHGIVTVIVVEYCGHLHFHFQFDPDRGFRFNGFDYHFDHGPTYKCGNSSYDTNAPDGTSAIGIDVDGSSYNLPVS